MFCKIIRHLESCLCFYSYLCGMKNIGNLIEDLLQWNDCVVVPSVGGFLTNYHEADIESEDEMESSAYPPIREVRFNQSLTESDGVLIHAYMLHYDAAYPAAQKQMQRDVAELLDALGVRGEYAVGHLGVLRQDLLGHIRFETSEMGIDSPYIYGLSAFGIDTLKVARHQREVMEALSETTVMPIVSAKQEQEGEDGHDFVLRIGHRWIDVAVSAVAAVLLFFMLVIPSISRMGEKDVIHVASMPTPIMKPNSKVENKGNAIISKQSNEKKALMAEKRFSIVLACYVTRDNAEYYITQLRNEGMPDARYEILGKKSLILYSAYESKENAQKALKDLRKKSDKFSEAWVMEQ